MSAYTLHPDWRTTRAITALAHGTDIDPEAYAVEFGLDLDETMEVFEDAARHLGMALCVKEERVLH